MVMLEGDGGNTFMQLTARPRKIRTADRIKPVLTNADGFSSPINWTTRLRYKGCTRVKALRQSWGGRT